MLSYDEFVVERYRSLIDLAKESYEYISYDDAFTCGKFVLWRHDCDFSLNRAYRLAIIEKEEGVKATYFVNPHAEFYNILESSQFRIIQRILQMGHDLGLHFDAGFYGVDSENQLHDLVSREASWLESWFGIRPTAFSFHNPTEFLLGCQAERYGGLVNCYSVFFKSEVGYCSDSNGYWRHRRLEDVLGEAKEPRLQVLTHPGWWQEQPMPPRDRIVRCVEGRAMAVLQSYDDALAAAGRLNVGLPVDER